MELLNILINPADIESTCFFCFKHSEETLSVHQKLFICNEFQTTETNLTEIMKFLFPNHDILLNQACSNCTSILLQVFKMLQKHDIKKNMLLNITTSLIKEVEVASQVKSSNKNIYVKLKMSHLNCKLKSCDLDGINININDKCITREQKCDEYETSIVYEYQYCNKCEMKFTSKDLLSDHEKIAHHNKNNSAICEYCGKDCKKPATLRVHLNCHKEKKCPYCSKTLKSHSHFKIHVKNHEVNVKRTYRKSNYVCNICPFKSLNKNSLEAHTNKIHLNIRPYVCEICNKGFYKKSNLTEHQITHTNVKNLTCEQCGESFVTKKTLIEHKRLHTGEKPYGCPMCNLAFITSGRRSDHIKRKHIEKTLSCFICDKKFSLKKELNSHFKKVHFQGKRHKDVNQKDGQEDSMI